MHLQGLTKAATLLSAILILLIGGVIVVNSAGGPEHRTVDEDLVYRPQIPNGIPHSLWSKFIPANNPMTVAKVSLGRTLFFDKRLSLDRTVSCATCHRPKNAFTDGNTVAIGIKRQQGTRNAPTVLNAMFNLDQFWDGRRRTLEDQAKEALFNPLEMAMSGPSALAARVMGVPEYRRRFRLVFGDEGVTSDTIAKAIAAFERTQLSGGSPFDRFRAGEENAISQAQQRGWEIFHGKAQCINCHSFTPAQPFFTDFKFHNTGVAAGNNKFAAMVERARHGGESNSELGRFVVSGQRSDIGAFKTPTLRNAALTAPYMHNGSMKTLLEVVRYYNDGGHPNVDLDGRIRPLFLTEDEMGDLVEFLKALTGDTVPAGK
jgi:cytochrome c peroxidase